MIQQEVEDLREIVSRLKERALEVVQRCIDVDYHNENLLKALEDDDVTIELENGDIYIRDNEYKDLLVFTEDVKDKIDDIPIEVLWNNETLDNYVKDVRELILANIKANEDYEYKRYLELKKKFEK